MTLSEKISQVPYTHSPDMQTHGRKYNCTWTHGKTDRRTDQQTDRQKDGDKTTISYVVLLAFVSHPQIAMQDGLVGSLAFKSWSSLVPRCVLPPLVWPENEATPVWPGNVATPVWPGNEAKMLMLEAVSKLFKFTVLQLY